MKNTGRLLLVLALLLASVSALAAPGVYDLELVIFEQPSSADDERFPESPGEPEASNILASLSGSGNAAANAGIRFLPLADGELAASAYTLGRKGAPVQAHLRWRQEIPESRDNPALAIRSGSVDGVIRLDRGRFIHLHTDLLVRRADGVFRVREHARARSGETYYVDHPKIGILFRADRYEEPGTGSGSADTTGTPTAPTAPSKVDNPPEQRAPAGELPRAMPDPT